MKTLGKLWGEFKKFIYRGNVLDLAVGVVIGAAFTAIVTSLTNDIIMPLINSAVGEGDLSSLCTVLKAVYLEDGTLDMANSLVINWGNFIQAILDFILIAIVIFAIVKVINTVRDAGNKLNTLAKRERELKKRTKKFVKQGMSESDAKARAAAEIAAEVAPAAPAKPTVEQLLAEIRDLLAANSQSGNESDSADGAGKDGSAK